MTGVGGDHGDAEPFGRVGRVSAVQQPETVVFPAATMQLVVEPVRRIAFHDFYVSSRDRIGRALAVTLRDADLAADVVDEAMARAYQRWDKVSTMDNPSGWVYRVGLNVARSRIRRLARRLPEPRSEPERLAGEPTLFEPAVMRALAGLSVDHRAVVVGRLLLGWSEAETAAALAVRPGTVKSRLHRALAVLEPQLSHLRPEGR